MSSDCTECNISSIDINFTDWLSYIARHNYQTFAFNEMFFWIQAHSAFSENPSCPSNHEYQWPTDFLENIQFSGSLELKSLCFISVFKEDMTTESLQRRICWRICWNIQFWRAKGITCWDWSEAVKARAHTHPVSSAWVCLVLGCIDLMHYSNCWREREQR